jgi:hypothetical protein
MAVFSFEESLLLYAIAYENKHKGIATLRGIFSAEDAINKSAPTFDEIGRGLNILLTTNLISSNEDGFNLTSKGERIYEKANQIEGNVFERLDHLMNMLNSLFSDAKVSQVFELHSEDYRQAYESYYRVT